LLYEKKYFGNGTGNFDDADFVLQPNQWVNMENCRVRSTDKGVTGTVESIGSNFVVSPTSAEWACIGSCVDEEHQTILGFYVHNTDSSLDKLVWYEPATQRFFDLWYSNQVIGGFNFSLNSPIHSARVINGLLYWVDGTTNEPRKINIYAALKTFHSSDFPDVDVVPYVNPIDWREITLIKPPPPLAPNITKNYDSSFANNFIANDSFSFVFQYIFYENETSVVGTYSPATRLNKVTDNYNRVIVTMDSLERIPQRARIVNLIVRVGSNAFVIKTWDKLVTSEATQIANQNSGSQVLTFNFYNNITGPAIASDIILKPFDSVPIYSEALEIAKNRLFLGNNIAGYDTPTATSLGYTITTVNVSAGSSINTNLIGVQMRTNIFPAQSYSAWYVYLTTVSPVGYYAITSTEQYHLTLFPPPLPAAPTTETLGSLTFRGATQDDCLASVNASYGAIMIFRTFTTTTNIVAITGLSVTTFDIFKTRSQYKLGVVFYDYAMRKCGVVTVPFSSSTSDPTLVTVPARNFAFTSGVSSIVWALSNTNALAEIPDWAHYYTVVRTLSLSTRYFIQAFQQTSSAKYATKDADGNYVFTNDAFVSSAIGIGIDTTSLVQAGLGYTFTDGDVCYLIKADNTAYTLSVIGQSGKYILVNVPEGGIGDFTSFQMMYEIYTPYQTGDQEPYYEVGNMYRISNPRTVLRQYETTSDFLLPDIYALTRNFDSVTYFAEAMSPNDRFFNRWDNDAGKINYVLKSGQSQKKEFISFSNTFIPGTATNGLSSFEALNQGNVPLENGAIQKLILTSKTQDQGTIMLAVCTNETSSIYLNEARITDSTGTTQFFASSLDVIGTINNLKGSFGTVNPESVIEFRGNVYWVDVLNGKVVQYSLNGLFPISSYQMTRYWKLFCEQYLSMTQAQIIALGSRPFIFTTVDPNHWELLITVPKLLATPPLGYLPDSPYTSYVYPFDIWDGQAKTLVFKINAEPNFWQGAYSYTQENYITLQNKLFSFKSGQLYEHNDTNTYCNFNGVQYKSRIMFIANQQPERDKVYDNIAVEANLTPTLTYFMSLSPYTQVSNLQDFDWQHKESVLYCQIYRNVLTPSATGLKVNALVTGEKMRTYAFRAMLEFTVSTTPMELRFVNLGYQLSLGHSIPVQ
jgi:hypothetical protein